MERSTKACGKKISSMATALKLGLTLLNMKASTSRARSMGKEFSRGQMAACTEDSSSRIILKESESTTGLTDEITRVNG